jgi:hypothetical protein
MRCWTCAHLLAFCILLIEGASEAQTACEGLGTIVRREVHQLSDQEWADYVEAFNLLTNKSSVTRPGFSVYEQFTADHDVFAQHSNPLFLAWHRLMLWEWDKALDAVKPGVVQPYFDWSVSSSDIFADSAFDVNRFGNSVATDGSGSVRANVASNGVLSAHSRGLTSKLAQSICLVAGSHSQRTVAGPVV